MPASLPTVVAPDDEFGIALTSEERDVRETWQ